VRNSVFRIPWQTDGYDDDNDDNNEDDEGSFDLTTAVLT